MTKTVAASKFLTTGQCSNGMGRESQVLNKDGKSIFGQNVGNSCRMKDASVLGNRDVDLLTKEGQSTNGDGYRNEGMNNAQPKVILNNGKHSFANLFKNNRTADESSMLKYIAPPLGEMEFGFDEIDTVEHACGFCLVGFVMGPRPSPYTVLNFVKGWGINVTFSFKENGWIKFKFPNELERDSVLKGGPYMIMGRQLYLKELPRCFLFSKEDMIFLPSWVQIHGLPADCWTTQALSRLASVIGKPIHTDKMTISKQNDNYARVLVELDAKKPRILEYSVKLPTGRKALLKFIYEHEPKFCDRCNSLGHLPDMCGLEEGNGGNKGGDKDRGYRRGRFRVGNRQNDGNANDDPIGHEAHEPELCVDAEKVLEKEFAKDSEHLNTDFEQGLKDMAFGSKDEIPVCYDKKDDGDENSVHDFNDSDIHSIDFELDGDGAEYMLSRVVPQDKEEWKKVGKKNKKFLNKQYLKQGGLGEKNWDSGSSSMETENVPIDPRTKLPLKGGASKFLKK